MRTGSRPNVLRKSRIAQKGFEVLLFAWVIKAFGTCDKGSESYLNVLEGLTTPGGGLSVKTIGGEDNGAQGEFKTKRHLIKESRWLGAP